jgi:Putative Actinobacterial Holin-X, holin superfamily III
MDVVDGNPLRERSTGELVKDLSRQLSMLARQEVELAKAEMTEKGRKAGAGAGLFAAGAVAALLALGALTAFLILALAEAMPGWLAALLVTLAWAVAALALALLGKQKVEEVGKPVPEKTVESVKEDIEWLKNPTR